MFHLAQLDEVFGGRWTLLNVKVDCYVAVGCLNEHTHLLYGLDIGRVDCRHSQQIAKTHIFRRQQEFSKGG